MTDQPAAPQPPPPPGPPPAPAQANPAQTSAASQWALASVRALREQIGRAVVGQDEVVSQVLAALIAGGHVLLEGVPGVGKTLIALSLSRAFGGEFARIQFTPDLMPSDVTGHSVYRPETGEFRIRKGPAFTNLLLADEINRAPAKTQAALLEVMQEQQVSIEGQSFRLPGPFMVLATQNPLEHEGTYPLPEAQLDRFLVKVLIEYPPTVAEEVAIVARVTAGQTADRLDVDAVQQTMTPPDVLQLQSVAGGLTADERILDYAVRVVRRTRSWGGLRLGTGPRGAIALVRTARAFALLEGRDFVLPDDVKRAALPVLRHRVQVAPELEMSGETADQVLTALLDDVEAPRQ
ncbi:MAG: MoxR family ATPase [Acidobacteriota bacterium]